MDLSDAYDVYDLDNKQPVSRDCLTNCAPGAPAICDAEWCRHECHRDPRCPCDLPGDHSDCIGAPCPSPRPLPPHAARALMADVEREMARDPRPGVGGFGPRTATQAGRGGTDVERARAMDDRDQAALANVARDVEAESKPDYRTVYRERFGRDGWPRRGAA